MLNKWIDFPVSEHVRIDATLARKSDAENPLICGSWICEAEFTIKKA